jgi:aminobenzoyl-glutamate utilization protein B
MSAKQTGVKLLGGCVMAAAVTMMGTYSALAQTPDRAALKQQAAAYVDANAKLVQQIVDSTFSFQEIGYHEIETQKYLTGILRKHGFEIQSNIAGMPTAWLATWSHGSGKPTVSLNNDEDGLPGLSQWPGVLKEDPMIVGGPGQAEGHNSGLGGMVVAALALKEVMSKNNVSGTIQVWPGVAEEIVGGKAWYVRAGVFKDVDAVLSTHVGSAVKTEYGRTAGTGLISVIYTFNGKSVHAAGAPWEGKSALASVEMMDVGINFMRQFFRPSSRTHNVLPFTGDQPNIVPHLATNWYYYREVTPEWILSDYAAGNRAAKAAADMFGTTFTSKVVGSAWPSWANKPLAEAVYKNIQAVGLPQWSEADQAYAKGVQKLVGKPEIGLTTKLDELGTGTEHPSGGGSDDIGDVMWSVPSVRLIFPSNIPGIGGHNWAAALAGATPIAHKGSVAEGKVLAMTALDLYLDPGLVAQAKKYFDEEQPKLAEKAFGADKPVVYASFLPADAAPAIHINDASMKIMRPLMQKFYYNPARYGTYLEQLGIKYPCLTQGSTCGAPASLTPDA